MSKNIILLNKLTPSISGEIKVIKPTKVLIDNNKFKVDQKITDPVLDSNFNFHPWFIVGFAEAKGYIYFNIFKKI